MSARDRGFGPILDEKRTGHNFMTRAQFIVLALYLALNPFLHRRGLGLYVLCGFLRGRMAVSCSFMSINWNWRL